MLSSNLSDSSTERFLIWVTRSFRVCFCFSETEGGFVTVACVYAGGFWALLLGRHPWFCPWLFHSGHGLCGWLSVCRFVFLRQSLERCPVLQQWKHLPSLVNLRHSSGVRQVNCTKFTFTSLVWFVSMCTASTCIWSLSLTLFCHPLLFLLSASFHHTAQVKRFQFSRPSVHSHWIVHHQTTLLVASYHLLRLSGQMSRFMISLWVPLLSPSQNHSTRSRELQLCWSHVDRLLNRTM